MIILIGSGLGKLVNPVRSLSIRSRISKGWYPRSQVLSGILGILL